MKPFPQRNLKGAWIPPGGLILCLYEHRSAPLLKALIKNGSDDRASLAIAGWCLTEDIQLQVDLRTEIKQHILEALNQSTTIGDLVRLVESLLAFDFYAAIEWLRQCLDDHDQVVRLRVFSLLSNINPEYGKLFVPISVSIMDDEQAAPTFPVMVLAYWVDRSSLYRWRKRGKLFLKGKALDFLVSWPFLNAVRKSGILFLCKC